jgi:hypothetical protein
MNRAHVRSLALGRQGTAQSFGMCHLQVSPYIHLPDSSPNGSPKQIIRNIGSSVQDKRHVH